jgi:uncharacterized protein (DUF1499 family)
MRRAILRVFSALIFGAVLIFGAAILFGSDRLLEIALGPVERRPVIFPRLVVSDRPNHYLVCPDNFCAATADRKSAQFDIPVSELQKRWRKVIDRQPRITLITRSTDGLQADYVQKSAIIGFPDTITIRFIPLGDKRSTLAIFSRSHYGHSDLGVNGERIDAWLSAMNNPE